MTVELDGSLVRLPETTVGEGAYEPHAAIDPSNPLRAAVVAACPAVRMGLGRHVWCWRTSDGGKTWLGGRVPQAKWDGEGMADALVGYTPDGGLLAVAMNVPDALAEERAKTAYPRDAQQVADVMPQVEDIWRRHTDSDMICVARSDDHGATWSSQAVPGSPFADKTQLGVDHHRASPYHGQVYVTWADYPPDQLAFARSADQGRTFGRAVRGNRGGQIAVTPDGAVHLVWPERAPHEPESRTRILHATSSDGGATFTDPVVAAEYTPRGPEWLISLAAAPSGQLLAVWSEADGPAPALGVQPRTTLRWLAFDGATWTEPALLGEPADDLAQGLPAVASTDRAWHVLSYDTTLTETTVRIHSAPHASLDFQPTHDLATRALGAQDIFIGGDYQLRAASDIAIAGDYVGLAGTASSLVAALILPEDDDWHSTPTPYAALLTERVED
jgi:hypothetical protein